MNRGRGASGASGASGAPPVALAPLARRDLAALAALWNASLGVWHPLTTRALEGWWSARDTERALTFGVRRSGALVGALLARAPRRSWAHPAVGHVSLLTVAPDARRQGLGSALWDAALAALHERGRSRVQLGAGPGHLLPGVPAVVDDASWRFLLARGVVPGALETDVLVDLRLPAAGRLAPHPTLRLVDDDPDATLAFIERCFPGRWADEVAGYAAAGTTVLALREGRATRAFAVAFRPDDALLGPSLTWSDALPGPAGGIGPLGVDPAVRGRGIGLRMVAETLAWQHARGARDVVLDWTTLTGFYGRLGGRVWRTYQRAEVGPPRN